ncbi:tRNA (adenosine(37)-N6)-dimethylallyltransferase MiaA [Candidatus Saccharibacteria bacterium]|nr:tRNA (adenosine(37)-N6)-dimethylallyltransferase MiaA [Candidatus Saccharibacteria bacterium]
MTPLIVIVGPTASGKTALAVELAIRFNGEIICADSRTIYRDMNIGTAKPSHEDQLAVPHWGIDIVDPGDRFTAADFKRYANTKIDEIRARGHTPFLVGGTGLYVDAVVFDYKFGVQADQELREKLSKYTLEELHEYCIKNNIKLPENQLNKRYVIRAIEQAGVNNRRKQHPISTSIIVGIATDRQILRTRIEHRTEQLFKNGVVEEAIMLGKKYGWSSEAMTGNIYPLIHQFTQGTMTLLEVKNKFTTLDWRLAKRQLTWLRRNTYIKWYGLSDAEHYLSDLLASDSKP